LVESDTESEEDPGAEEAKQRAEEERLKELKRKEEEEANKPTSWACGLCTFLNSMAFSTCDVCRQGQRPPMDQLIAEMKR
jgi:hypothetical protein